MPRLPARIEARYCRAVELRLRSGYPRSMWTSAASVASPEHGSRWYATIAHWKHRDQLGAYLTQTEEAERRVAAGIDSQPPQALRRKVDAARRKLLSSRSAFPPARTSIGESCRPCARALRMATRRRRRRQVSLARRNRPDADWSRRRRMIASLPAETRSHRQWAAWQYRISRIVVG